MNTPQRAVWDGHPVALGNAFELRKPKGLRELHAVCCLDPHRCGYELRLEVNGLMWRTLTMLTMKFEVPRPFQRPMMRTRY